MASVFTRIVNGEIPSYKVAETVHCYAFLDINPLKEGHTLVIPKKEVDYLFDLDEAPCKRVGVAVLGMEVPHAHIHLVPLETEGDLDFRKKKLELTPERFKETAASIAAEYAKL